MYIQILLFLSPPELCAKQMTKGIPIGIKKFQLEWHNKKGRKRKFADKPGSVERLWGHRAVIRLGVALPQHSSGLPGSGASHAIASLFGLAPDGVCRAGPVTSPAVGFYPTISPLPDPTLRGPSAVYFLLHFPSPHGVRPLAGILLYGARTFLRTTHARRLPGELPGDGL